MVLHRVACPECGAEVESSPGFTPGQIVSCTKCRTEFTVEDAIGDGPSGRPAHAAGGIDEYPSQSDRAKEWSYQNSWLRFAVLGVLLTVLVVLGYMLYQKRMKERDETAGGGDGDEELRPLTPRVVGPAPKLTPQIPAGAGGGPKKGGPVASEPKALTQDELRAKLVGKWESKANDELITIEYAGDGTFSYATEKKGQPKQTLTGKWKLLSTDPGIGGPTPVTILNLEWTTEGKPALKEAVLLRMDGKAGHPHLDQEFAGKKAGSTFTKAK